MPRKLISMTFVQPSRPYMPSTTIAIRFIQTLTTRRLQRNQGSFLIEELTDLVEEAVMAEFHRLTDRGGVLGAMERMYQRNKIQEESLYYETLKHTGEFPIVGVNTFLNKKGSPTILPTGTSVMQSHLLRHWPKSWRSFSVT